MMAFHTVFLLTTELILEQMDLQSAPAYGRHWSYPGLCHYKVAGLIDQGNDYFLKQAFIGNILD